MPLNKLENFIKNTEGRILYVNANDLDATDAVENQGNSLARPFKTIQRALLESARFSYLKGSDNDTVEKTTILLFPGEHVIDNRPGYAIKNDSGTAKAVSPAGSETVASTELSLNSDSVFDLTQSANILYKFNSVNGGVIVPRGTSIVGLDLRKTKIRPKYVPNPTDNALANSTIFRITGACYFWQFSLFDADESGLVYTDSSDFSSNNQSTPTFSHHKLSCFEYADGVNLVSGYDLTDLSMYYAKLSNAFNTETGRDIDQKYPANPLGFAPQRPEFEIVGAFAADPVDISTIISGDGATPNAIVTVTTSSDHGLTAGTPIKIRGVNVDDYNISTKVQNVTSSTQFTYLLPFVRNNLPAGSAAGLSASSATVVIETDTVSGASPYIFNISLRSIWGMNGLHADGSKASGFRSLVTAQFTGVSLQKDDRAFVKYNESSRLYEGITVSKVTGSSLSRGSSSTTASTVYHLDSDAVYRNGWESSHIKASNDAFIQVVSVFAIGYTKHFDALSGADYSITNSNSNFGQLSLSSVGFKKEAFTKDNKGYITSIVTPRAITSVDENIDWVSVDVGLTTSVGITSHLYLYGYTNADDKPPVVIQGYRVGAKVNDKIYFEDNSSTYSADVFMVDNEISTTGLTTASGTSSSYKQYSVSSLSSSTLTLGTHSLLTGEKILVISDDADLPENVVEHRIYYTIRHSSTEIKLASSLTNAENGTAITIYGGSNLKVVSRVSDKDAGDVGSPIQYDASNQNWFVHTNTGSDIYNALNVATIGERTNTAYFKRKEDDRSIDEKLYKFRVVIPKEFENAKDPEEGFVIQESSTTSNTKFSPATIDSSDYEYDRNPRFISTCSVSSNTVTVISELPHGLDVNDQIIVKRVTSTDNTAGTANVGYNGTFVVSAVTNDKTFQYSTTDVFGKTHSPAGFTNDTSTRNTSLPRFERNDLKGNYYIYRSDVITPHVYNVQDGIYHLYVLNADNAVATEFTNSKFSQNVTDLYPQFDRDNEDDNPAASKTYAKRAPIGDVVTNDLKKSITRETADKLLQDFSIGLPISSATKSAGVSTITFTKEHNLSGIVTFSALAGGSGYTNGTYQNVKLLNDGTSTWDGATARVVVSGGSVTTVDIVAGGSGYADGEELDFDTNTIGGGTGAGVTISSSGISTIFGNTVQITGIGTTTGGYYRVLGVPGKNQISVASTAGDPEIIGGQYLINIGPQIAVDSSTYTASTGISTFTTSTPHGLVVGNRFRVLGVNGPGTTNENLGDYLVTSTTVTTFNAKTNRSLAADYILKHAMSSNDRTSDIDGENFGARGFTFYDNEVMTLGSNITNDTSIHVSVPNSGISTTSRFEIGSYIQVDNEIMRITSSTLSGSGNNEITVIRGSLGTVKENHSNGSQIKKIKPLAVEFRRPSIVRASGHTFEYLGYGPGNYSTGLPQIQKRTLSEKEEYLAQAQEKDCGIVVYTGMNNDGDFFIGNKKINSATGKETNFDIPVSTITGEDPSRLSVVFDEVIVKERILVEGGNSGTVLSQFDGPVKFNKDLRINGETTITETVRITEGLQSTSTTTGDLIITGGVGIAKNLNVGGSVDIAGNLDVTGNIEFTGITTFTGAIDVNDLADIDNIRIDGNTISATNTNGDINITANGTGNINLNDSDVTIDETLTVGGFTDLNGNLDVAGTLNVAGITTLGSNLIVNGTSTLSGDTAITGDLTVTGDITAFFTSDQRLKDNVTPIEDPLAKILSISGNTYDWNEKSGKEGHDVGVIAQEVLEVLPEAVTTRDNGYLAVDYQKIVPLLVQAVKELSAKVDNLEQNS